MEYFLWLGEICKINFSLGGLYRGQRCLKSFATSLVILSQACIVGSQDPASSLLQGEEKGPVGDTVKGRGGLLAAEIAESC